MVCGERYGQKYVGQGGKSVGGREIDKGREVGGTRCEKKRDILDFMVENGIEVGWALKEIDGDTKDTRGFKAATRKRRYLEPILIVNRERVFSARGGVRG